MFNFTPTKKEPNDEIHRELIQYADKINGPSRYIFSTKLNDADYSELCRLNGTCLIDGKTLMEALTEQVNSMEYQNLSEGPERAKDLNRTIFRYRTEAKRELIDSRKDTLGVLEAQHFGGNISTFSNTNTSTTLTNSDIQKLIRSAK